MDTFILIFGMMLVTFGVRYPVLVLVSKIPMPEPIFRALRYVPAAVLAAIVVPSVLMPNGEIDLQLSNAHLVAAVVAGVISWRTKNLMLTIVIGMAVFLFWRFVVVA